MADPDCQPDADDSRPWEQPGAVRRDVPPHRAYLLRPLAGVSLACGVPVHRSRVTKVQSEAPR
jgi:hypothetical protein